MSVAVARVAGSDTREAAGTATVRALARAAALAAAPGWLAALAAPSSWERWVDVPAAAAPWIAIAFVCAGLGSAVLAWRRPVGPRPRPLADGADAAAVGAVLALIVAAAKDPLLVAVAIASGSVFAGWVVGRAARLATAAVVPDVAPAAAGTVVAGALLGLLGTGHLALVWEGSGAGRAGAWACAYAVGVLVSLGRAALTFPRDRRRVAARATTVSTLAPDRRAAILAADGVVVRFGPNTVLEGTSLSADRGEMVALVGGNGAGKSTLLRVIAGLLDPETGRTFVDGEDVSALLPEERAAAGLAFVSGARPVFPDLTVVENLRVAAFRTHLTPRSFAAATDAVLELVPVLAARRGAKAGVLSGGEQRLLAVAQTLYARPKVLLADELSLGLDADARVAVLDLLRLLADQGVAVVVVDHDLPTLLPRADRAALLARGTVTDFVPAATILDARTDLLPATFLAGASG